MNPPWFRNPHSANRARLVLTWTGFMLTQILHDTKTDSAGRHSTWIRGAWLRIDLVIKIGDKSLGTWDRQTLLHRSTGHFAREAPVQEDEKNLPQSISGHQKPNRQQYIFLSPTLRLTIYDTTISFDKLHNHRSDPDYYFAGSQKWPRLLPCWFGGFGNGTMKLSEDFMSSCRVFFTLAGCNF